MEEKKYKYIVCISVGRSTGKWRSKFAVRSLWYIRGVAIVHQIPVFFKYTVFELYFVGQKNNPFVIYFE